MADRRFTLLAILDGWGIARPGSGNAISLAHTPHMNQWRQSYPTTELTARGTAVGLPPEITGNSEVGHINLGAGYIVPQDQLRIQQAIDDGSWANNPALLAACQHAMQHQSSLHLLILVSPAMVHSSLEHLWAMLDLAKQLQMKSVFVHAFSDGRDSSPSWLAKNAAALQARIEHSGGTVASLIGRYYAMDRDQRWDRTQAAYRLLTERKGRRSVDLESAAQSSYQQQKSDEFIEPTVIANGKAISDNDAVVFLNFRTDRPRQLSHAFCDDIFTGFERDRRLSNVHFCTMTEYERGLSVDGIAFPPVHVEQPLAAVLADAGLKQLHAAETEKYAHVTYFFNGGQEDPFPGEDRMMVPSPKVATYDLQPEMSAQPLTDLVCQKIDSQVYTFVVINFANADMVGHTGDLAATVTAVETVDQCLGQLWQAVHQRDGVMAITADHGNAEVLVKPLTGDVDTEHNPSNVPLLVLGDRLPGRLRAGGTLANVSPTILEVLDIKPPASMTAPSLWEPV